MGSFNGLTIDLLKLIAEKIANHADVLRFGAACREFRSIIMNNLQLLPPKLPLCLCALPSKPPPLPLLMQFRDNEWENINFFSLSDGRNHGEFLVPEIGNKWVVGSSHGWLFTVDTRGRDIHLLNPLTRAQIPLPSLDAFVHPRGGFTDSEYNDFGFVEKAILSSDPSNKRRNSVDGDDCVIAMAIISNPCVLSFCKVGDDKWTNVEGSLTQLQDVIYYKGQIYAVNYEGIAVVYDFAGDKKMKQIANAPDMLIDDRYLVESIHGELLLVVRMLDYGDDEDDGHDNDEEDKVVYETTDFLVYKLESVDEPINPEGVHFMTVNGIAERGNFQFKWVEIESLGDQALFLGQNYSLCVPAVEYQGCKPNCIYFTDHGLGNRNIARGNLNDEEISKESICDMGIYDFGDESFQRFSQLNVKYHAPPIWISPNPW
ncbi:putative F-box protein At1g65770 [Asparagus officinalis]|uniref:putative F-box protein At1g65770 n=1 Tax=Asparagus officinalis TaxID=4686 RepID=UPI00098E69D3|nr:putative F-box protein At1g65770 [Asparagus officinalis]XP_020249663.1 putative F-box protein At1g65770 [Asparagus officinalis]XP_020249664.1 putative F-box protein At1g65770 [Asparagus officinalis]XP_020249665.1 putative F-box protein At1g65770 [Asparagus officinalis]